MNISFRRFFFCAFAFALTCFQFAYAFGIFDSSNAWNMLWFGFKDPGPGTPDPQMFASEQIVGISVRDESHYINKQFICDDGATNLIIDRVNDDYCDCRDGSDEPGTAACAGKANSFFFCANIGDGQRGNLLPSSRVFDGICDCCDGSDENLFDPKQPCANSCIEKGKMIRFAANLEMRETSKGREKKQSYIDAGKDLPSNADLEAEADNFRQKKETVEMQLTKINEEQKTCEILRESERKARMINIRPKRISGLKLPQLHRSELEILIIDIITEGGSPKVAVRLIEEMFHNRSIDEQNKGTVDSVSDTLSSTENDDEQNECTVNSVGDTLFSTEIDDDASGVFWEEEHEEEHAEVEEYESAFIADDVLKGNGCKVDFESIVNDLATKISALETALFDMEERISKDYGPQNEFFVLDGQCFNKICDGNEYKICPYGSSSQGQTDIGKWVGFKPDSEYKVMLFEKGETCWNGIVRSLEVTTQCGSEDKITKVSETSICVYSATLVTPAAC